MIQPTDAHYDEIQSDAASSLLAQNHGEDAQKLLRAALGRLPASGLLQLRLAELLAADPSHRVEALSLLEKPIGSSSAVGVSAIRDRALDQRRQFQLAHQRLDAYASSSDESEKAKLLSQLDAGYDALSHQIAGEPVLLLRLRAAIEVLKGQQVEAMSTLRRALTQMEHSPAKDYELLYQAAMLNRQEGQNGVAEQLLGQIIAGVPRQLNARLAMAELLLEENAPQQAAAHIDVAEQIAPDSPQVLRLRVQQLTAENKIDEARAAFNRFPETDPESMYAKARLAAQIDDAANAERLLIAVRKASPQDPVPASLLAQIYLRTGRKQQAESLLEEQLKTHPKDLRLLVLKKEAEANSPQGVQKIDDQIIAATDEFSRQMLTSRLETRRRNFDAAKTALDAADRLRRATRASRPHVLNCRWPSTTGQPPRSKSLSSPISMPTAPMESSIASASRWRVAIARRRCRPPVSWFPPAPSLPRVSRCWGRHCLTRASPPKPWINSPSLSTSSTTTSRRCRD